MSSNDVEHAEPPTSLETKPEKAVASSPEIAVPAIDNATVSQPSSVPITSSPVDAVPSSQAPAAAATTTIPVVSAPPTQATPAPVSSVPAASSTQIPSTQAPSSVQTPAPSAQVPSAPAPAPAPSVQTAPAQASPTQVSSVPAAPSAQAPSLSAASAAPPASTVTANTEKWMAEIMQKKELARHLDEELYYLRHQNQGLAEKERIMQERMLMRQKDQKQLRDNYNEHIRSRRATKDDPASIHKKLQDLKAMIKTLSVSLAKQCDPEVATKAVISFWVNLHEPIKKLGSPLPLNRIEMLTEKFLMDVLVQNMNYNGFTGLKISQPYTHLQMWFDCYDPGFCTRLRQEIAKVVVLGNVPGSDIHQEMQKLNRRMHYSLQTSLLKAFPFMTQHDQEEKNTSAQYTNMLQTMVELASEIGCAIRGQEVEIAAAAVGEGSEPFDPKSMVDEDGQTSGTIQLCISPPFIIYGNRVEILEKARVLCTQ